MALEHEDPTVVVGEIQQVGPVSGDVGVGRYVAGVVLTLVRRWFDGLGRPLGYGSTLGEE